MQKLITFLLRKLFARIKREKKLFEAAEGLKNCVLAYQNRNPRQKNNGPSPILKALGGVFRTSGNARMKFYQG